MSLDDEIRELTGRAIRKALKGMVEDGGEVNAALIGKAMDWLGGKGQKPGGGGDGTVDPYEAAMNTLKAAREAGGKMPAISEDDDPAS